MRKIAAIVLLIAASQGRAETTNLIVHEWGTFTSFQDANGATISGINVDDEPVPKFVHRLHEMPIFTTRSTPALWSQGAPRCHPDVTLRLETPVLYFYPPSGFSAPLEVRAGFNGGWLTEFYPFADAENSGFPGDLDRESRSALQWKALTLGQNTERLPSTKEQVWLAPREVHAAVVTEGRKQEAEKYLFYRGVGHIDAPLIVREKAGRLDIMPRFASFRPFPELWLVRVQPDGRVRYTHMPAGLQGAELVTIPVDNSIVPSSYDDLYRELEVALVKQGLYTEEARAMLETWELSYFKSEGLRVMFVLPRSWIDAQLPLSISAPADITRVMLGRIEVVSSFQREKLKRLLELPAAALELTPLYVESRAAQRGLQTGLSHADLYRSVGREVPEALQLYDQLGRFRDALLVHEWNATRDESTRARLSLIMRKFSACTAAPPAP